MVIAEDGLPLLFSPLSLSLLIPLSCLLTKCIQALTIPTIRVVVIIAEGMPENEARILLKAARDANKVVIGPATVGGIQAGSFRIGNTAGTMDNIINCKLYRPGSVGFVSKSGGLSNEMYNVLVCWHGEGING